MAEVIFITDDAKEDWWHIVNSQGDKQIGPHPLLRGELFGKANIKLFHMYSADLFLTDGKSYLTSEIQESSITDAKEVAADPIQINSKLSVNENRSTTRVSHEQDAISQYEVATSLGLEPDWNMDLDRLEIHRQALEKAFKHEVAFEEMLKYKSAVDVALEHERAFDEMFKHKSAVDVAFERERALEEMLKHRRVFRRPK